MVDTSSSDDSNSALYSRSRVEILDGAIRHLRAANRSSPRRTAEWLLTELLECDRADLYAEPERSVSPEVETQFEEMVDRRVDGEPIQHILGYASFYGLKFEVSPDVMVPRPETELVVERALSCLEGVEEPRVFDVGTGSGCIALTIKHERPDALVYGCDVSRNALAVARRNAGRLSLDVEFFMSDVSGNTRPEVGSRGLDLIVSNPPYIPRAEATSLPDVVRNYDPEVALFANDDPLSVYRDLTSWVHRLCRPEGAFVFEVHADYGEKVKSVLVQNGIRDVHLQRDLNNRPRIIWGHAPETAS